MKKEHNLSAVITLVACAVAVLCGLLKQAAILSVLKAVLVVLIVFFTLGRIAEYIFRRLNEQVEEADRIAQEEAKRQAEEESNSAQEEAENTENTENAEE